MNSNNKFIYAAEDLGGLNAIEPLISKLGGKLFRGNLTNEEIENAVKEADMIVAGTSTAYESLDKKFIRAARKLGRKSVAILDSWVNYEIRFKDAEPDYIFVMDELAKQDMLGAGFPEEKILVTGNPYFDKFKKIDDKGDEIIFFCQPFTELENNLGLNEVEVLSDLVDALKKLGIKKNIKVKMHPRTKNLDKFDALDIEITNEEVSDLIRKAELVIGMNSMALFEAAMSGKKVLSYQPGLTVPDPLATNRMKITKAVYKKEDLENAIVEILKDNAMVNNYKLMENATDNCVKALKKLP